MMKLNPTYQRSDRGNTLMEVMVGTVILTIAVFVIMTILDHTFQRESVNQKGTRLHEIFYDAVNEARGYSRRELPKPDTCWVKYYSLDGELVRVTKDLAATSSLCFGNVEESGYVIVVWRVLSSSNIQVEFSNSEVMKLPRYSDSIVQLDLIGRVSGKSDLVEGVSLTLYKN